MTRVRGIHRESAAFSVPAATPSPQPAADKAVAQPLPNLQSETAWVVKTAKNKFYKLFEAAAQQPQPIEHRDGRRMVLISEDLYEQARAASAKSSMTLAERFRAVRITQPIERPEPVKQSRPRALDMAEELLGQRAENDSGIAK